MFRLKYLPHRAADEEIIFFLRRHWFIPLKIIIGYILLGLVPVALYIYFQRDLPSWLENETVKIFLTLLVMAFYLFWWMMFYYAWLDYFLDAWIVTNYRIINIEQRSLFNRFVAEQKLYRVQDVVSEQKGVFPTILNYGEVQIQTAGTEETVFFEQIPKPQYVAQEIIKLVENRKKTMGKMMEGEQ
jgi:hypothetical protein